MITLLEFEGKLIFPLITAKATESPRSYTKSNGDFLYNIAYSKHPKDWIHIN